VAGKAPLNITPVNVGQDGTITVLRGNTFTAMLNPSEFTHTHKICYNTNRSLGQIGPETKFSAMAPDTFRFALMIDGTGAVPARSGKPWPAVSDQIKQLSSVVYKYNGDRHEPSHVRVLWGSMILYGRLSSMEIQYTLFAPSGAPLRAKVSMAFIGFMTTKEAEAMANRSSPDLTHAVVAREGDTLPLLCERIYGDAGYYPDVARFNGLAGFRRIPAGTRLFFPPLA
jgi:hypothetical protein